MKYRIVDVDNRAEYSKPKTFEEVKAWFEPNAEFEEDHDKLEFDGKEYEAEIDELECKFCLFEIED